MSVRIDLAEGTVEKDGKDITGTPAGDRELAEFKRRKEYLHSKYPKRFPKPPSTAPATKAATPKKGG